MQKIHFIYVWRLCEEKGCDLILDFFKNLDISYIDKVTLDVYGDGVLRTEFEELGQKMYNVTFHGYTHKEIILENWKNMHYTLMPSRFLETFGLSALDSFGVWVPVVWFRKWWLEQFGECVIDVWAEQNFATNLTPLINMYSETAHDRLSKICVQEFKKYNKELWLQRCRQQLCINVFAWKKIVLASDYIVKLGGIETYILDVKELLEEQWAQVKLMWCDVIRHGWKRYLAMIMSLCNVSFGLQLKKEVDIRQPDIIRWHSVHRWIGWFPLRMMINFWGKQVVMYHDFWLLHPFPSQVYDEEQLWYNQTLASYIQESGKTWSWLFLWLPLLCVKWWSALCIWKLLRSCDMHLVPSAFMKKWIVRKCISKEKVFDLPHFV